MDYEKILLSLLISLLSFIDQVDGAYRSYRYYYSYRSYSSYNYYYYYYYTSSGSSWVVPVAVSCSLAGVGLIVGFIICLKCCVFNKNKPGVVVTPAVTTTINTVEGGMSQQQYQGAQSMYTYGQPPPPPAYVPSNGTIYPHPQGSSYSPPDPAYPPGMTTKT